MSTVETYIEWLSLRIDHPYYENGRIPLALVPTQATQKFMARYNLLLRSPGPGEWRLLVQAGKSLSINEDTVLVFGLKPSDAGFYYCTGEVRPGSGFILSPGTAPGEWLRMEIPAMSPQAENPRRLELQIMAAERYWEYLLIGHDAEKPPTELCDEQEQITFRNMGTVILPDASAAKRFVTTNRIPLRKSYPYQLSLWEIRKAGRRLLSDTIPFPDPAEASVTETEETIAVYCYY